MGKVFSAFGATTAFSQKGRGIALLELDSAEAEAAAVEAYAADSAPFALCGKTLVLRRQRLWSAKLRVSLSLCAYAWFLLNP